MTELQKRVISAVVMIPAVLCIIYVGGWVFNSFVILLAVLMLHEWFTLTKGGGILWKIGGVVYIGVACFVLLFGTSLEPSDRMENFAVLLGLLILVWSTDTGAYFIGKKFGKKKLAPKISPNKTWAGFFGGIFISLIVTIPYISIVIFNSEDFYKTYPDAHVNLLDIVEGVSHVSFYIICLSIISQLGDLFESWVKRKFGVKDSGNLIPGHGGILDRLDGLLAILFVVGIALIISILL